MGAGIFLQSNDRVPSDSTMTAVRKVDWVLAYSEVQAPDQVQVYFEPNCKIRQKICKKMNMKHRKTINICDKACFTALLRLDSYNSGQDSCPSPVPSQASFFLFGFYCSCCALVHNHNSGQGSCPSPVPSQESFSTNKLVVPCLVWSYLCLCFVVYLSLSWCVFVVVFVVPFSSHS